MKIISLLLAFFIWMLFVFLVRIYIKLEYHYQQLGSHITLELKVMFLRIGMEIIVPREMLHTGLENVLNSIIKDASNEGVELSKKETKSKRYLFLRHFTGEVFRKYLSNWSKVLWLNNKLRKLKKSFYRKIVIQTCSSNIQIGGRDAAETGMLVGVMWSILGRMTARLYSNVTVKNNCIKNIVLPNFNDTIIICQVNCIFSLKNSHIIFTAFKLLAIIIKIRRTGNNG